MSLTRMILRLVSHWYDPDEQVRREQRTAEASDRATTIRDKSILSGQRVVAVRHSYEQSERRARPRPTQHRG